MPGVVSFLFAFSSVNNVFDPRYCYRCLRDVGCEYDLSGVGRGWQKHFGVLFWCLGGEHGTQKDLFGGGTVSWGISDIIAKPRDGRGVAAEQKAGWIFLGPQYPLAL